MRFYWSVHSLPELRDVPAHLRHQIANDALGRMRVSFFSGTAIIAFMFLGSVPGIAVGIAFGKTFGMLLVLPFFFLTRPLLMNLARAQIREHADRYLEGV
jgi:hypothetical protein